MCCGYVNNMAAIVNVIWSSVKASFYIYGFWFYFSEILCLAIPTASIGALLIFILVHIGRIPPPDPATVEEILGQDPLLQERDDKKKDCQDGAYIMKSIAHRGAALDAPENSITAFRQAKQKGMTAVEFDVALTRDKIPIVFHDDTVDRMTEATGRIKNMTWEELKQLDISEKHPMRHKYGGERIPLFEDAVKECLDLGLRMFIDLKGDDLKLVSVIHNAYKHHKEMYTRAIVSSFSPLLIYMIRRGDPCITSSLAWRPHVYTSSSYSGVEGEGLPRYKSLPQILAARSADAVNKWAYDNFYHHVLGLSVVLLHKDTVTSFDIKMYALPAHLLGDLTGLQHCSIMVLVELGSTGMMISSSIVARLADMLDEWALHYFYDYLPSASLVGLLRDTISEEVVRLWKERGLRVMPWTVNMPLEKQYFTRILKVTYLTDTLIGETDGPKFS